MPDRFVADDGALARAEFRMIKRIIQRVLVSALIAVALAGTSGAQRHELAVPSDLQLLIMIKSTLIAFNDANTTGNYTVLRDLASPEFQQTNTPARLGEIFHLERGQEIDISPIVLLQPRLWRPAAVDAQGLLHVQGYFPSKPKQVNFTLGFKEVAGRWRLHALGVSTTEPTVAAQADRSGRTTVGSGTAPHVSPASEIISRSWHAQMFTASQVRGGYRGWAHPDLLSRLK
jgi:hypothetical protein